MWETVNNYLCTKYVRKKKYIYIYVRGNFQDQHSSSWHRVRFKNHTFTALHWFYSDSK